MGAVVVEFIITTSGDVVEARVVRSTHREFENAAVRAVRKWKFAPGEKDGRKVNTRVEQVVEFSLDVTPVYPRELLVSGVRGSGTVEYVLDIQGRVTGAKILAATHPEFGQAIMAAVMAQTYMPNISRDINSVRTGKCTVEFKPDSKDALLVTKAMKKLVQELGKNPVYPEASALDQKLRLTKRVKAPFPVSLAPEIKMGTAIVEAFVNESGEVLLPRIVSATEDAFGYAAAHAMASWQFEPPIKNGQKVTTLFRTEFKFSRP